MRREQLEHPVRAAGAITGDDELIVIGSQAIPPEGWRDRLVPLRTENTGGVTAWCLDPHDLVASELAAARPEDVEFARALLEADIVDRDRLTERIDELDAPAPIRERAKALLGA